MREKILLFVVVFMFITPVSKGSDYTSTTIVLVHGAWHGSWVWFYLEKIAEDSGFNLITVNLPAHGIDTTDPSTVTLDDYKNAIVDVLDQQEDPVILVGHSLGGIAISVAAEARPEKVDKLVYLAAFMLQNNQSMFDIAFQDTGSMILPSLILSEEDNTIDINHENIKAIFYSEATDLYTYISGHLITPEPMTPVMTPIQISCENYGSIPRYYIKTTYDNAISLEMQEQMIDSLPCEAVGTLDSDHSPFFSMPSDLATLLKLAAAHDPVGDSCEGLGEEVSTFVPITSVQYKQSKNFGELYDAWKEQYSDIKP